MKLHRELDTKVQIFLYIKQNKTGQGRAGQGRARKNIHRAGQVKVVKIRAGQVTGYENLLTCRALPPNSHFPENSISIGCQSTNRISRQTDRIFELPASSYLQITISLKTRFLLVVSQLIGFQGKRTACSNSPPRVTPKWLFS